MSKKKAERRLGETEAMAVLRNLRTSPRKLNLVAESIRGLGAAVALSQLAVNKRRVAQHVRKALQSAIANAENNHQLDVDRLFVKEASVGKGLVMRRFHPRARGRASAILKPFSHIVIIVGERGEAA
ncbi:MAG: 50S ribosomal protein L22 [Alphaproteobacteria bacterium]|nr:50S ribosomal protein L22 [Alphaproteobacteria bacterium]